MDHDKQCVLVIIGADAMGNKDIVGMVDGYRESAQSWKELLLDLKRRGLETGPELAVGDGALGFWKALREVYGETRVQRCWVHKTANVLNQMPKSLQAKAKGHLHDIWMAETRADAEAAFDFFIAAYGAKYHKAAERLVKDRERLLSFYDFPAEHWKHIRTTNPIESTFATVRLRTVKTKGCLSRKTALAMAFKLILSARRKWRKLDGSNQLAELVEGVPFKGRNQDNQTRRLIAPSPTFGHSSPLQWPIGCQRLSVRPPKHGLACRWPLTFPNRVTWNDRSSSSASRPHNDCALPQYHCWRCHLWTPP